MDIHKPPKLILVLGGARSGKSSFAEKIAADISDDVTYVATAAVLDSEMARRVEMHKNNRPEHWTTKEETVELVSLVNNIKSTSTVILIDCLTIWLSNLLLNSIPAAGIAWPEKESYILDKVKKLAIVTKDTNGTVIIVSNEVSLGLVPDNRIGRSFRDVAGLANQIIAKHADKVYLLVAGIPLELKSLSMNNY
jgi:adenosylcobinamide kinase/adenosylcobinamide-phosphate guanylyltransferase